MENFRSSKLVVAIFTLLFFYKWGYSQTYEKGINFGEGSVLINWYGFSKKEPVPAGYIDSSFDKHIFDQIIYYIKKDKILKDRPVKKATATLMQDTLSRMAVSSSLTIEMMRIRHLIDYANQKVYTVAKNRKHISKSELKKEKFEFFYRMLANQNNKSSYILNENSLTKIAGKNCFMGIANVTNNKEITIETDTFYYTKDKLKIKSPLNAWLPNSFPYNIMSIKGRTDWTDEEGKPTFGYVVFQVREIAENEQPDSLFVLPKLPTKKNMPFKELYINH